MKLRGKPGAKRRARGIAKRTNIRIDVETKEILQHEFGSLGNALFFLRQGIEMTKKERGLPSNVDPGETTLNKKDISLLLKSLLLFYNNCGGKPGCGRGNGGGRTRVQIERIVDKFKQALKTD